MSAAWLTGPVQLTGMRMFSCEMDGFAPDDCKYYVHRWHFWYIADYVYALPTIAFFMTAIGLFIIGNVVSSQILGYRRFRGPPAWKRLIATIRYLSYRGFHVERLRWSSAPVGVLLLGAAGAVFFFCMDLIPQPYYWSGLNFGGSPPLGTRSGWMALACMPFVFATASKANWITLVTGISHERLQVFHRWISYAFFLLALMHTFPFIVYHIRFHDMMAQVQSNLLFYWTGIVALVFQAWLTFASHGVIRKLGYEFFKATHLAAVVVFIVVFFWHCDYTLTSWHYFIATAAVYVPCYAFTWLRTCFEYGISQRAHIHVEENGFTRITIPGVGFRWHPGQHCFLRFPTFGLQALSSHPFTICSLPLRTANGKSDLIFYVRHQRGLTMRLWDHAIKNPDASVPVLVDGPYGGINMQRFNEADQLLVVAGGSGAGWLLPFIELFAAARDNVPDSESVGENFDAELKGTDHAERGLLRPNVSGPASLRVILATREASSRVWFLDAVSELLSRFSSPHVSSDLRVQVNLTGEAEHELDLSQKPVATVSLADSALSSSSASTDEISLRVDGHVARVPGKERQGRPQLPRIVREEAGKAAEAGQSLSVYVCGPDTMQNDVRNAAAQENLRIVRGSRSGGVYLHSEHFSWA